MEVCITKQRRSTMFLQSYDCLETKDFGFLVLNPSVTLLLYEKRGFEAQYVALDLSFSPLAENPDISSNL